MGGGMGRVGAVAGLHSYKIESKDQQNAEVFMICPLRYPLSHVAIVILLKLILLRK